MATLPQALGLFVTGFRQTILVVGKVQGRDIQTIQGWEGEHRQTAWDLGNMGYEPIGAVENQGTVRCARRQKRQSGRGSKTERRRRRSWWGMKKMSTLTSRDGYATISSLS